MVYWNLVQEPKSKNMLDCALSVKIWKKILSSVIAIIFTFLLTKNLLVCSTAEIFPLDNDLLVRGRNLFLNWRDGGTLQSKPVSKTSIIHIIFYLFYFIPFHFMIVGILWIIWIDFKYKSPSYDKSALINRVTVLLSAFCNSKKALALKIPPE